MAKSDGDVLTSQGVSELLQLSRNTIFRYIREGRIPATRAGNKYLFLRSRVLEALEAGFPATVKSEPPQDPDQEWGPAPERGKTERQPRWHYDG